MCRTLFVSCAVVSAVGLNVSDPCADFESKTSKGGKCEKPNVCPSDKFNGEWAVYAVPCAGDELLYDIDPGWGGLHVTLTHFQKRSEDDAVKAFNKFKEVVDKLQESPYQWYPKTFQAIESTDGTRKIGIVSQNLERIPEHLETAGWNAKTGNWHSTQADMAGKSFKKGDSNYKERTNILNKHRWAFVLVQAVEEDGQFEFKHSHGFPVSYYKGHLSDVLV